MQNTAPYSTAYTDGEEISDRQAQYIEAIWDNPNWEIDSLDYVGDGWSDGIMTVEHDGIEYWTKISFDGDIYDFGDHSLVRSNDGEVLAEFRA